MQRGSFTGLVGDIGGTNARFALASDQSGRPVVGDIQSLPGHAYAGLSEAARDYLARVGGPSLDAVVFACAGPVVEGSVSFTNVPWTATERELSEALGAPAYLINDLAAVAWAVPVLEQVALRRVAFSDTVVTPPPALAAAGRATRAILNAGTGCNASAWVENESGQAVMVGEFGHTSFAPTNALEIEIWRFLAREFGHVSNERVLAGPGLLNLYQALAAIEAVPSVATSPAAVSEAAAAGDGLALRATEAFCAIMGGIAGDVALTFGARGGLYLAGGVAARVLSAAQDTAFRTRFEAKGRFRTYLADIPTLLIQDQNVALLGAGRAMGAALGRTAPPA